MRHAYMPENCTFCRKFARRRAYLRDFINTVMLRTCGHAVSDHVASHVILRHSRETAMCEGAGRTPSELNVYNGAIVNEPLFGF